MWALFVDIAPDSCPSQKEKETRRGGLVVVLSKHRFIQPFMSLTH